MIDAKKEICFKMLLNDDDGNVMLLLFDVVV